MNFFFYCDVQPIQSIEPISMISMWLCSVLTVMLLAMAEYYKVNYQIISSNKYWTNIIAHLQIISIDWCDDLELKTLFWVLNQLNHLMLCIPFHINARELDNEIAFFESAQLMWIQLVWIENHEIKWTVKLTSANEFGTTSDIITGESPRNLKPYSTANSTFRRFKFLIVNPSLVSLTTLELLLPLSLLWSDGRIKLFTTFSESMFDVLEAFFKQTLRGTVQCRFAEKMASGPSFLNGSSIWFELIWINQCDLNSKNAFFSSKLYLLQRQVPCML